MYSLAGAFEMGDPLVFILKEFNTVWAAVRGRSARPLDGSLHGSAVPAVCQD